MRSGAGRMAIVLGGATLVIAGLATWERASRANDPVAVATVLRDELRETRARVAACLVTQDRIAMRFEAVAMRSHSLRAEVEWFESLDPRGVPGVLYPSYLELVEEFNASVTEWERESTDLVEYAGRCRSLVGAHNAEADSLQRYLVETGIWAEDWLEPGFDEPAGSGEGPPAEPEGLPVVPVPED